MKSICIIPIYNEYDKLNKLLSKIKKNRHNNFNLTYLAINNGSSDQSLDLIKKNKVKYINLKKNYGVGYALMTGFLYAKKNHYDYIVHLAGNGKMNPAQIKNFLKKIHYHNYEFVSGSRFLANGFYSNNPVYRIVLIKLFSQIVSFLFKKKITDCSCGFRAFKINLFKNFKENFFKKELFTYGYEYYSYGAILKNSKINFLEIPVSMDYQSKLNYTKMRPFLDWFIIAKYWIKSFFFKGKL